MPITIIGAGFVGLHAYSQLSQIESCLCTVTSKKKQSDLQNQNIQSVVFKSSDSSGYLPILSQSDRLVICVAPKDQDYENTYLTLAKTICSKIENYPNIRQIIVLSSTSVYLENSGGWVTESSPLDQKDPLSSILIETEHTYLQLQSSSRNICIYRLGEIYGKERNLKQKFLKISQKCLPGTGLNFANLIHVDDIVEALKFAILNHLNGIYNLVCDEHPKRLTLYQTLSELFHLPLPQFDPGLASHHGKNKKVDNSKIKRAGWKLVHPAILLQE